VKKQETKKQRVMSVKEVSEYLRIPASTVYHLAKTGKIRAAKYGKHWRFFEEDVLSYHYARQNFLNPQGRFTERRQYSRINTEIPVELTVLLYKKKGLEKKGIVPNLSEGGMLFGWDEKGKQAEAQNDAKLMGGDPVKVVFEIPGSKVQRMELEGRVVHTMTNSTNAVGVKFRNISSEDQGVIRNYVG